MEGMARASRSMRHRASYIIPSYPPSSSQAAQADLEAIRKEAEELRVSGWRVPVDDTRGSVVWSHMEYGR